MTEAEKIARAFSRRPSDQNWCWLYLILSGRSLEVRKVLERQS